MIEAAKSLLRLGSASFIVFSFGVGVVLLAFRRTRRAARVWVAAVFVSVWLLSTPAVALWLSARMDGGYRPIGSPADARGADTVVVLSAGGIDYRAHGDVLPTVGPASAFRVLEAARVYRLLGASRVILAGGRTDEREGSLPESEAMRRAILQLGVPADRLVVEASSANTREEAEAVAKMVRPGSPIVLVTSPTHMRRAAGAFRAVGLDPVPSPSRLVSAGDFERRRWLPDDRALLISDAVFYDLAAWVQYKRRGWLDPR